MKIAVIGGGASGLMAAIAAKETNPACDVYILEKEKRVGKKILATGNGRCNLTNSGAGEWNYHGCDDSFVAETIPVWWVSDTLEFFSGLGVLCKEEQDGKIYPYSDTASAVLDVLRRRCDELEIKTICEYGVKLIKKQKRGFELIPFKGDALECNRVIVAAGGKASPALGSDGSGYELLKKLGHRITKLSPSLVQIKTNPEVVRKLKGIKVNARLTIDSYTSEGDLLFTDYGISGPPVFNLSAIMGNSSYVEADIMPEYSYYEVLELLRARREKLGHIALEEFFVGMLNKRVGQALLKSVGIAPLSRLARTLTEKELKSVAGAIKAWKFEIEGTMSWNNAQVTHGGAMTKEFESSTMQSKLVKGLYACGEILDVDGDCGGYNLQWAWTSGYIAGKSAALSF